MGGGRGDFAEDVNYSRVEVLEGLFGISLVRIHNGIHMAPEKVFPSLFLCRVQVEVLELCEGHDCRGGNDIDSKDFRQTCDIEEEGVFEGESWIGWEIRLHRACIIDHVYILRRPASCDVGQDGLLQIEPIACETYKERRLLGNVSLRRSVP